jgi:hypothetical protein
MHVHTEGTTKYKIDQTSEYLLHMALGEVIDALALSRYCDQRAGTRMPQLSVQGVTRHSS